MTSEHHELGKYILAYGKNLAPDRFPKPTPEVAEAWGEVLSRVPLPVQVWPEAVKVWASELVGDRMATPRELREAAYLVRDRWEDNPATREVLEAERDRRRELRDQQLRDGTFALERGYARPEGPAPDMSWLPTLRSE